MSSSPTPSLSRGLLFAMAAACGVAVANLYYNQPLLGLMTRAFGGDPLIGFAPTATQLGYALGLFFLVPLADIADRRRLIVLLFCVLALCLVGLALAPSPWLLLLASALVGIFSAVAQLIVPLAASLASPEKRGRAIGTVMSGLLCGLLFSRTLAGLVAVAWGWRAVFWLAVPLSLAMAAWMAMVLPRRLPFHAMGYGRALRSLGPLWLEEPVLRRATLLQACLFATFTGFWAVLAFRLEAFHLGADVAGLFGVVAAAGVFAAPLSGRMADRRGPGLVLTLGAGLVLASWLLFGLWPTVAGLVVGVVLLDFAVQSVLVSNQHRIYALRPEARGRLNTLFMTGMFSGGALGSAAANAAWGAWGWRGVCLVCGGLALLALLQRGAEGRRAC